MIVGRGPVILVAVSIACLACDSSGIELVFLRPGPGGALILEVEDEVQLRRYGVVADMPFSLDLLLPRARLTRWDFEAPAGRLQIFPGPIPSSDCPARRTLPAPLSTEEVVLRPGEEVVWAPTTREPPLFPRLDPVACGAAGGCVANVDGLALCELGCSPSPTNPQTPQPPVGVPDAAPECSVDTVAIPPATTCAAFDPCMGDPFGAVPPETRFVDASATVPGDGRREAPFQTLEAAGVGRGGPLTLALFPGQYQWGPGPVQHLGPLVIIGACADQTEIRGPLTLVPGRGATTSLKRLSWRGLLSVGTGRIELDRVRGDDQVLTFSSEADTEVSGQYFVSRGPVLLRGLVRLDHAVFEGGVGPSVKVREGRVEGSFWSVRGTEAILVDGASAQLRDLTATGEIEILNRAQVNLDRVRVVSGELGVWTPYDSSEVVTIRDAEVRANGTAISLPSDEATIERVVARGGIGGLAGTSALSAHDLEAHGEGYPGIDWRHGTASITRTIGQSVDAEGTVFVDVDANVSHLFSASVGAGALKAVVGRLTLAQCRLQGATGLVGLEDFGPVRLEVRQCEISGAQLGLDFGRVESLEEVRFYDSQITAPAAVQTKQCDLPLDAVLTRVLARAP